MLEVYEALETAAKQKSCLQLLQHQHGEHWRKLEGGWFKPDILYMDGIELGVSDSISKMIKVLDGQWIHEWTLKGQGQDICLNIPGPAALDTAEKGGNGLQEVAGLR